MYAEKKQVECVCFYASPCFLGERIDEGWRGSKENVLAIRSLLMRRSAAAELEFCPVQEALNVRAVQNFLCQ